MSRQFTEAAFHDAVIKFVRMVGSEHQNLSFSDFDMAQSDGVIPEFWFGQVYREFGEEQGELRNPIFKQFDTSEEEVEAALEMYRQATSESGRPSKVDKWEQLIETDEATLDEAKEDMSDPTWYKLKDRLADKS